MNSFYDDFDLCRRGLRGRRRRCCCCCCFCLLCFRRRLLLLQPTEESPVPSMEEPFLELLVIIAFFCLPLDFLLGATFFFFLPLLLSGTMTCLLLFLLLIESLSLSKSDCCCCCCCCCCLCSMCWNSPLHSSLRLFSVQRPVEKRKSHRSGFTGCAAGCCAGFWGSDMARGRVTGYPDLEINKMKTKFKISCSMSLIFRENVEKCRYVGEFFIVFFFLPRSVQHLLPSPVEPEVPLRVVGGPEADVRRRVRRPGGTRGRPGGFTRTPLLVFPVHLFVEETEPPHPLRPSAGLKQGKENLFISRNKSKGIFKIKILRK